MSFELHPDESLRKNIRRILRDQMDRALESLTGPHEGSRDEAVHETRQSFKKIRAVLRLVRPVIDEKSYREENTCFRDRRRADLEQEALLLGRRYFQDSPGDFARRLKDYWKARRAHAEPEPPDGNRLAMA
jgi:hypothetical protein